MEHGNPGSRVGGMWLAIASGLMIAALLLHGPIATEPADQMARISNHASVWSLAHWMAAAALSLYAVAGLIVLTFRSSLTRGAGALSAWAVLLVGSLWTLNTAVAEATVVTDAAIAGSMETFVAWWAYAEGKANGFSFVALALALIAATDARDARGATPSWAAWTGMVAGLGSFTGWALGMWFEVPVGNVLWVTSSILTSAWTAWFGLALARSSAGSPAGRVESVRQLDKLVASSRAGPYP